VKNGVTKWTIRSGNLEKKPIRRRSMQEGKRPGGVKPPLRLYEKGWIREAMEKGSLKVCEHDRPALSADLPGCGAREKQQKKWRPRAFVFKRFGWGESRMGDSPGDGRPFLKSLKRGIFAASDIPDHSKTQKEIEGKSDIHNDSVSSGAIMTAGKQPWGGGEMIEIKVGKTAPLPKGVRENATKIPERREVVEPLRDCELRGET